MKDRITYAGGCMLIVVFLFLLLTLLEKIK